MPKEDVLKALERAIIKASRNLAQGKRCSTEGLARLASAYHRLQSNNGAPVQEQDPLQDGDPDYFQTLFEDQGNSRRSRRLPR